jgi:hypothetical protein
MVGLAGLGCDGEGIMLSRWYEANGLGFTLEPVLFLTPPYDLFWPIPSPTPTAIFHSIPLLLPI